MFLTTSYAFLSTKKIHSQNCKHFPPTSKNSLQISKFPLNEIPTNEIAQSVPACIFLIIIPNMIMKLSKFYIKKYIKFWICHLHVPTAALKALVKKTSVPARKNIKYHYELVDPICM